MDVTIGAPSNYTIAVQGFQPSSQILSSSIQQRIAPLLKKHPVSTFYAGNGRSTIFGPTALAMTVNRQRNNSIRGADQSQIVGGEQGNIGNEKPCITIAEANDTLNMIPESNAKTLHQKIRTRDHSTSKLEPLITNGSSLKINVIGLPGTFGGAPLGIGTAGVNRADLMSKMDTTHQSKDKK